MTTERKPAALPDYLRTETIGRMHIEDPHYIEPSLLYVDQNTGELYLNRTDELEEGDRTLTQLRGKVAIMLASLPDYTGKGYVADLRMVGPRDGFEDAPQGEAPSDQEELNEWVAERQNFVPVVAIYAHNPNIEEDEAVGDKDFINAVRYLAEIVDTERKQISARIAQAKRSGATGSNVIPKTARASSEAEK